jgi:hypothetical protein
MSTTALSTQKEGSLEQTIATKLFVEIIDDTNHVRVLFSFQRTAQFACP